MTLLEGVLARGGTSKCWIFSSLAMAEIDASYDEILAFTFGASDQHELDGVGGGTSVTSKAAIVGRSLDPDADVDYLFAQVGLGTGVVEWDSNCGNCATAVGLHAVTSGLVPVVGDVTPVRMRNRNTGAVMIAEVDTPRGRISAFGEARVPGVVTGGVGVGLKFLDPAGGTTGVLLPTGSAQDLLEIDGSTVRATMVDAGAPCAFFSEDDVPLEGSSLSLGAEACRRLLSLRPVAARAMSLVPAGRPAPDSVPKVGVLGAPRDYVTAAGESIRGEEFDLTVRMMSMRAPHPAVGLTSAVAVAAAVAVPGSLAAGLLSPNADPTTIRVGTASGIVRVRADLSSGAEPGAAGVRLTSATLFRAARVIARAQIQLPFPAGSRAGVTARNVTLPSTRIPA